jgi:hypothetical protein
MDMATLGFAATALTAAAFLALLVERLVEHYFGKLAEALYGAILKKVGGPGLVKTSGVIPYVSGLLGLALCVFFKIDLVGLALTSLGWVTPSTWAGSALTGLLVGGGSNMVHDVWPGGWQTIALQETDHDVWPGGDGGG